MPELTDWLVGDFEQSDLLKNAQKEEVQGICFAACVYWIAHHMTYRSSILGKKSSTEIRLEFLKKKQTFEAICGAQSNLQETRKMDTSVFDHEMKFINAYGLVTEGKPRTAYLGGLAKYYARKDEDMVDIFRNKVDDLGGVYKVIDVRLEP
ncbi:MAG: hypothetical protein FJX54_18555 [Alphaproteobacteria bacterium]|nr:hypothetical protein [Alphaproteobacteria bacterium]